MKYKILADLLVILHFGWILFMLWGFGLTVYSIVWPAVRRGPVPFCSRFMERWLFRDSVSGRHSFCRPADRAGGDTVR